MAECVVTYDLTSDADAGTITLTITDSTGTELPMTENLKPLITKCFESLQQQVSGCSREYITFVDFTAGPGAANPETTAAFYRSDDDKPTRVCVVNSDTGQEAIYWILKDSNGSYQWHQSEN